LGGVTADGSHPHHPLSRSVGLVDCWLIRRDLPSVPTEPPGFTAGSRDFSPLGWDPRCHQQMLTVVVRSRVALKRESSCLTFW
jgi:hypothetical protein